MKNSKLVYSTANGDQRKAPEPATAPAAGAKREARPMTVRLDAKGRKGKPVTMVENIAHNPQVVEGLAKELKTLCGAGGTVEGGAILVQGDHRDKIVERLNALGHKARRI